MLRFVLPRRAWPLALAAALAGCQTPRGVDPPSAPPAAAAPVAPPAALPAAPAPQPTLLDEQRRLSALFQGTPVVFAMQTGGVLRVDVPLRFSFGRGQAAVKPALAAVLDRVAQSQHDRHSRIEVNAAGDAPAKPGPAASAAAARTAAAARAALGARRAGGVRARLVSQGIAADRIAIVDGDSAGVRLRVSEPPVP